MREKITGLNREANNSFELIGLLDATDVVDSYAAYRTAMESIAEDAPLSNTLIAAVESIWNNDRLSDRVAFVALQTFFRFVGRIHWQANRGGIGRGQITADHSQDSIGDALGLTEPEQIASTRIAMQKAQPSVIIEAVWNDSAIPNNATAAMLFALGTVTAERYKDCPDCLTRREDNDVLNAQELDAE